MTIKERRKLDKYYSKYGITYKQYELMSRMGCDLCGKKPKEGQRRLAVDHNHKSGKTRGILCMYCNKYRVGRLDIYWAQKVYTYLVNTDG